MGLLFGSRRGGGWPPGRDGFHVFHGRGLGWGWARGEMSVIWGERLNCDSWDSWDGQDGGIFMAVGWSVRVVRQAHHERARARSRDSRLRGNDAWGRGARSRDSRLRGNDVWGRGGDGWGGALSSMCVPPSPPRRRGSRPKPFDGDQDRARTAPGGARDSRLRGNDVWGRGNDVWGRGNDAWGRGARSRDSRLRGNDVWGRGGDGWGGMTVRGKQRVWGQGFEISRLRSK